MKRAILYNLFWISLWLILFFCIERFIFFREVELTFGGRMITYNSELIDKIPVHRVVIHGTDVRWNIKLTNEQLKDFIQNHKCVGYLYKEHLWWFVIVWIAFAITALVWICILCEEITYISYNPNADIGKRFDWYKNCNKKDVEWYNYLDSLDLSPFTNSIKEFFGYGIA